MYGLPVAIHHHNIQKEGGSAGMPSLSKAKPPIMQKTYKPALQLILLFFKLLYFVAIGIPVFLVALVTITIGYAVKNGVDYVRNFAGRNKKLREAG